MPFDTDLQVALTNPNGCPITTLLAGIAVTFTAPASGPSGTFSASGANAVLVGTDASGTARASLLTANTLPGGYLVTASSPFGSVTFSLVNTASGVPATVVSLAPQSQSATVVTRYPAPLQVRVLDADGNPVQGANVTFGLGSASPTGGNSGGEAAGATFDGGSNQAAELTNNDGIAASPRFVAGTVAGRFTGTATVAGISEPVSFDLSNLPARPPHASPVGKWPQSAKVDSSYPRPLEVRVLGAAGQPSQGITVTFVLASNSQGSPAANGAGASFPGGPTQATTVTNAHGIASSPRFTANTAAGAFTATASVTGVSKPLAFGLRNQAAKPSSISAGVAANESTSVGALFPIPLAVTVVDKHDNPVSGVLVRFSAPAHGAGGTFVNRLRRTHTIAVKTNSRGIAVAPAFVANETEGGYVVKATAGHARAAAFALVNEKRS
jgi:adhesin/invasin